MLRRSFLALAALFAFAVPAAAQDDPVSFVREVYRVHAESEKTKKPVWFSPHRERFFTAKLARMLAHDEKAQKVGFDFIYNGQDFKITELDFVQIRQSGNSARVEAKFKNFGEAQRLAYDLVKVGGAWRIAEIREVKKGGWVLSVILVKGG